MCDKDGKQLTMSIKHYYKLQYDIDIKDKQQPLFIKYYNNNNNSCCCCYLVPELLFMCGNNNNEYKRRVTTPKEKILKIQDIQLLLNNTNAKSKKRKTPYDIKREWGIQLHECYAFKSRILLSPNLHFANTVLTNDNSDNGSRTSLYQYQQLINTNNGFTKCNWICITYFHNESKCVSIISNIITASKRLNVHIEQPHIYALNTTNFINELKEIKLQIQLQLVLIVLCNKYSYLYKDIKHYFNMKGIPSQCIIDEKAKTLSYSTKVLTQMVCKINGELFRILLDNNLNSKVSMIIGIDVIRSGSCSGDNTYERVCVTSTYNQFHSKVNVEVDVVKNSKEMSIVLLISKSLDHFKKVNKKLPSIILIYRKGGNDVQNEKILHNEIPFIVELFNGKDGKNCYMKDYTPMICVIAVNTKTDLKFFQQCPSTHNVKCNSTNMYTNPEKGTVIDDDIIINSNRFEFYLQSQYVNQGTASPVHFTVLYDTTSIPLEVLENITYKQTYYYWNWNGSIRIPAILKYAEVCNAHLTTCSSGSSSVINTTTTINAIIKDRPFYL